jgi:hypothetical protein
MRPLEPAIRRRLAVLSSGLPKERHLDMGTAKLPARAPSDNERVALQARRRRIRWCGTERRCRDVDDEADVLTLGNNRFERRGHKAHVQQPAEHDGAVAGTGHHANL